MGALAKPEASEATGPRRTPWRDNSEALVVAIVMAVFLKYFVVEAYRIPTGSMQPTLMGQAFGDGGGVFDRILVDKLSFHVREPQRWEVAVFKYPLDRAKNFVKRIWGLPGEELRIRDGDVWVRAAGEPEWRVLRRPRNVQDETLRALDLGASDPMPSWKVERGDWAAGDRELQARGPGAARFVGHGGGPIVDRYLDGYPAFLRGKISPRGESGTMPVGDLRLGGRVRALAGLEALTLELTEGPRRYRFELPGPAAADARPGIAVSRDAALEDGPTTAVGEGPGLAAGRWTRFQVQNLDDQLELRLDGRVVASLDVAGTSNQTAQVSIEVRGEGADLEDLQVWRDIYYLSGQTRSSWTIPAGNYFMLGDNTQDSSDSREWKFVNLRHGDEGSSELLRGNHRPFSPGADALDSNPWRGNTLEGRLTWFRDEWGETHVFPSDSEVRLPVAEALEDASFVPRELITGRAVAVFWPVNWSLGFWRLRWIH